MSTSQSKRGRTQPVDLDDNSSDEKEGFNVNAPKQGSDVKFRARVKEYKQTNQFPTAPLYAVNEIVYLLVPGESQPAGPFVVIASLENGQYQLKNMATGVQHPVTVSEAQLVVPDN